MENRLDTMQTSNAKLAGNYESLVMYIDLHVGLDAACCVIGI